MKRLYLKQLRERAGVSRRDIAETLAIDISTVTKWETGVAFPTVSRLVELAGLVGCTVDDLLREQEGEGSCLQTENTGS